MTQGDTTHQEAGLRIPHWNIFELCKIICNLNGTAWQWIVSQLFSFSKESQYPSEILSCRLPCLSLVCHHSAVLTSCTYLGICCTCVSNYSSAADLFRSFLQCGLIPLTYTKKAENSICKPIFWPAEYLQSYAFTVLQQELQWWVMFIFNWGFQDLTLVNVESRLNADYI